jgi:hypothetical protein
LLVVRSVLFWKFYRTASAMRMLKECVIRSRKKRIAEAKSSTVPCQTPQHFSATTTIAAAAAATTIKELDPLSERSKAIAMLLNPSLVHEPPSPSVPRETSPLVWSAAAEDVRGQTHNRDTLLAYTPPRTFTEPLIQTKTDGLDTILQRRTGDQGLEYVNLAYCKPRQLLSSSCFMVTSMTTVSGSTFEPSVPRVETKALRDEEDVKKRIKKKMERMQLALEMIQFVKEMQGKLLPTSAC